MFVIVMLKKVIWFLTYFGDIESSRKNESWFHIKTKAVWVPGTYGTGFGEVFTFHSQMNTRRYLTRKAAPKLVLFFRIGKSYTQNGLQMRSACWIQSVCVCAYIYIYIPHCACVDRWLHLSRHDPFCAFNCCGHDSSSTPMRCTCGWSWVRLDNCWCPVRPFGAWWTLVLKHCSEFSRVAFDCTCIHGCT